MIVYVVESGEYSGRNIEAVFSSQEKAEAFIRHMETDGGTKEPDRIGHWHYEEFALDRGQEPFASSWKATIHEDGLLTGGPYWRPAPAEHPHIQQWANGRYFIGYGETAEHARRSAEELRRQTLALEGKVVTR